ncbi:hypothetical protein N7519_008444 [Penicillium mononematosum]|uniref:uncharacterized protein n=1 Tax=Penicillium mononematosum TaxID=268346 RepID=UPI002546831F|nr:uncharacterized protein N7519_008444 [Penicillium mononematosum]KAJ6177983.1 hypothetical protein N7519_008444 [Penicillium mononematosum]
MIDALRDILREEGGVLRAIIRKQDDGENSISLVASASVTTESHRRLERILWDFLNQSTERAGFFSNPLQDDAKLILELAAQFETPGRKVISQAFSTQYRALFCLKQDDPIRNIIKEILENPPPLRKDHASRYDEHIPAFEFFPSNHGLLDGTVLDFYHEEHQASIQLKRRSIATIIYHEGPRNIMKPGQYLDLSSLKAVLSSPGESSKETQKRGGITAALGRRDKSSFEKQRVLDLKWIHLPGNDELMVRISQDQNITNKEHRPWADFVRKSWAELPAGGNKFYMKPQCVIPYLFWKKCPAEFPHTTDERSVQLTETATATQTKMTDLSQTTQRREIFHDSLTLDQYYYSSLEDTTTRDKDQVLWRSTDSKLNPRESKSGRNVDLLENRQTSDDRRKILIVNQLWLWILDEKTIITSTTSEIDETESSFLQRVLNNVRAQEKNSPMTVENIQELILSTATSFFNKKDVEVLGNKKSPLGVYRTAILNVRDKESHLFDVFQKSLDDVATDNEGQESSNEFSNQSPTEAKGPGESQNDKKEPGPVGRLFKSKPKAWKGRDTYSPYGNIAGETELLREVKDICDELNTLKSLAVDQEGVWNQVWKNGSNQEATFTYNTPFEVRKEITEMVKEAEFVQKAIDMLLDLKQKQANIVEAEFARKQSEDTAKQSDTIMAFTVVTILFLPASFLTSLLALDISDFPHVGDDVRFQGRVIFPIIFGVSISVSVSFAIIAYNASTLKEYVFGRRKSQKTNKPTNSPVEPKPPTVQQARQQAKLQMEQIRERFKLNNGMRTDDEYSWSGSGSDQMV